MNVRVRVALWRYDHSRDRIAERIARAIVGRLPRRVVYWAAIRLMAHATTGKWGNQEVPALRATDALQRWDDR